MNFFEWFTKWNGKYVDVDKAFGSQCVDLMRNYCDEVLNIGSYYLPRGDAKDIFYQVTDKNGKFEKIINRPWNMPKQGDIIFWKEPYGRYVDKGQVKYAGHVAIVNTANLMKLTAIGQNWGSDRKVRLHDHDYKYCLGWLRPRR